MVIPRQNVTSRAASQFHKLRLGWLTVILSLLPAIHAQALFYTLDVTTLVCPDRLIFIPSITTDSGTAAYSETFSAYISDSDGRISSSRQFAKDEGTVGWPRTLKATAFDQLRSGGIDAFNDYAQQMTPFILVNDWTSFTDATLHISRSDGTVVKSVTLNKSLPTFAGGSGTLNDPYLVATAEQLQFIACVGSTPTYYALTNDIDLVGHNFIPIGLNQSFAFRGGIDGRGFTIANMSIIHPGLHNVGFIGFGLENFLRNLTFTNPTVHGYDSVGTLYGESFSVATAQNITIEGGIVRGRTFTGGLLGKATRIIVSDVTAEVDVHVSTPRYHGPAIPGLTLDTFSRVGGVIGHGNGFVSLVRSEFDVRITQDPHIFSVGDVRTLGGLIGWMSGYQLTQSVQAEIAIDLTVERLSDGSSSSGGLVGGFALDNGSILADTSANLDVTLTLSPSATGTAIPGFGGIGTSAEEGAVRGLRLDGLITIDASKVTANSVTIQRVGGAIGRTADYGFRLHESHIDVDVIILGGANVTATRIGGLIGESSEFTSENVRVGGSVSISDAATSSRVGGLIGYINNDAPNVRTHLQSVVYRGAGVSVGASSSDVGTLWGDANGNPVAAGTVLQGTNVYWDADRNGVTSFNSAELGRPASSTDLESLSWLTGTADFDARLWCVSDGIPALKRLTPSCASATVPGAPGNLAATAVSNTSIQVAWLPPSDPGNGTINAYLTQYRALSSTDWTDALPVTPCDTPQPTCAVIPNLTPGTTYDVRVAAQNQAGLGNWSDPGRVTLLSGSDVPTIPSAPGNLAATAVSNTSIQVAWLPPSDPGNGTINAYLIQYRPIGSTDWIDALPVTPCDTPQPTCAVIPNLTPGTTYDVRVAAQNQAGLGNWSDPGRATLLSNSDVPTITSLITGTNRTWLILAPPSENTAGYEISLDNGATWNPITPHVGDRVLRVMNLTNGVTYITRVRAIRTDTSVSEPSIAVTMMPTPIQPTAPALSFTLDTTTIAQTSEDGSVSVDLIITNAGSVQLHDIWLSRLDLVNDTYTITDFTGVTEHGQWVLLDDWWYGENVQLPPGETHRVRITLEINP